MITKELQDYIRLSITQGLSFEKIQANLVSQGWHIPEIQEAYNLVALVPLSLQKQKRNPLFAVLGIFLVCVLGAGVAYGYYMGYFVSLDSVTTQSLNAAQKAKSGSFDTTVTIDIPQEENTSTPSFDLLGSFSGKYSLTTKGNFDFTVPDDTKGSALFTLNSSKFSAALEFRTSKKKGYFQIIKAPVIGFLPVLSSLEKKWVSFPLGEDSVDMVKAPLGSVTGFDFGIGDKLSDSQKEEFYTITKDAHFIKITKRLLPEKINNTLSYHFVFDIDRDGIKKYLEDVKSYVQRVGKNDSYLSTFDPTVYGEDIEKIKNFKGELWIGINDRLLYKLTTNFDVQPVDQKAVNVSIAGIFSDWNRVITVEEPKNAVTVEQFLQQSFIGESQKKAVDASIESNLANARAMAEIYYDQKYSYSGVCTSSDIQQVKKSLAQFDTSLKCIDSRSGYAVSAKISTGRYFCADSTGTATDFAAQPTGTSCR